MRIARTSMVALLAAASLSALPVAARAATPPALRWLTSEREALRIAAASGRPVLVDFWADWCTACQALDRWVWSDSRVRREAGRFVLLRIDGSEGTSAVKSGEFDRTAVRYGIAGLPTVILVDGRGRELDRIEGVVAADEMLGRLRSAERSCKAAKACS
jgi:thiol:disulfide interchange protein DsbD